MAIAEADISLNSSPKQQQREWPSPGVFSLGQSFMTTEWPPCKLPHVLVVYSSTTVNHLSGFQGFSTPSTTELWSDRPLVDSQATGKAHWVVSALCWLE